MSAVSEDAQSARVASFGERDQIPALVADGACQPEEFAAQHEGSRAMALLVEQGKNLGEKVSIRSGARGQGSSRQRLHDLDAEAPRVACFLTSLGRNDRAGLPAY